MAKSKSTAAPLAYDDGDWRAREDMRTLMEAEKIKKDPKRLAAAKACAKKKLSELKDDHAAVHAVRGTVPTTEKPAAVPPM